MFRVNRKILNLSRPQASENKIELARQVGTIPEFKNMLFFAKVRKIYFWKGLLSLYLVRHTHASPHLMLLCRTPPFCENAPPVGPVKEVTSPHGGLAP